MLNLMILTAVLAPGQAAMPVGKSAPALPTGARIISVREIPAAEAKGMPVVPNGQPANGCCDAPCAPCDSCGKKDCQVEWLRRWKCEDLEPKEPESKCKKKKCGGGLGGLLWCPKEEEECDANGCNGNGCENGAEAEEPETLSPLMQLLSCRSSCMKDSGVKVYGWLQGGYTANFDSPRDRLNYGVNFNNRSNDFLLNQAYLVLEKPLDLDKRADEFHVGYRVDFFAGHDAPYFENSALGLLDRFTGDRFETSRLSEMGIALPQFYVNMHAPILTERGVDFLIGRFYTLMTYELSPAPSTQFYSHSYEYFLMPYTHTGVMATVHLADTVDLSGGLVRGWEVNFQDNNDVWSYHGALTWTSCDKKNIAQLAWVTGPEKTQNNHDNRTVLTAYYTRLLGDRDEFKFVTGGGLGWEQNGTLDPTSIPRSAEWYSYSTYLFYTVDPRLTLGVRGEWYHDDDGNRTPLANSDFGGARWNRPGYAGDFYGLTTGVTWKPFQNLRVRPELRFDWFDGQAIDGSGSRPFNDQRDKFQTTAGFDVIYEF